VLAAFELPWDGTGTGDTSATYAAASSSASNWSGAALYADIGDGSLRPLGPTGRSRSIVGLAVDALPVASPLLFDRMATVTVQLAADDFTLNDSTPRSLSAGANRALIGSEIIQFGKAVPLGNRQWRLEQLLRGRGGTESATVGHASGERFVLLNSQPILLDATKIQLSPDTVVVAIGLGDSTPVEAPIAMQGISLRPLAPVHPRAVTLTDNSLLLDWTRRARGGWNWLDGVDVPLHEQTEAYLVTYGTVDTPLAMWEVTSTDLVIDAAQRASLAAALPGGAFRVRQKGTYALSEPLVLATLP
jgi:hypothetical protein